MFKSLVLTHHTAQRGRGISWYSAIRDNLNQRCRPWLDTRHQSCVAQVDPVSLQLALDHLNRILRLTIDARVQGQVAILGHRAGSARLLM